MSRDEWAVARSEHPLGTRLVLAVAVLVGSAALLTSAPDPARLTWFTLCAGAALVLGELLPVRVGGRVLAPISTAASLALVTTRVSPQGMELSAGEVVAIAWVCLVVGRFAAVGLKVADAHGSMPARFLGVVVSAIACRGIELGERGSVLDVVGDPGLSRPAAAALLLATAVLGGLVERLLDVLVTWRAGTRRLGTVLGGEAGPVSAIAAAVVATAPLIALTYPVVGAAALPLFLLPISLVLIALRRYLAVQATQDEVLTALSRLPEVAAGGRPGHSLRVAALAVRTARQLGLGEGEQRVVQRTALLHDIGQVGLRVPLQYGMTLDAPQQQIDDMVAAGQQVVSHSVDLPGLREALAVVHDPYRHSQERGQHLPVEARIVKVVNAYDDLTEGATGQRVVALALERLHLGLGYEYDPTVVEALERAVSQPS